MVVGGITAKAVRAREKAKFEGFIFSRLMGSCQHGRSVLFLIYDRLDVNQILAMCGSVFHLSCSRFLFRRHNDQTIENRVRRSNLFHGLNF